MNRGRLGLALLVTLALVAPAKASALGPPQIPATWVTDVTPTSATLRAEVNPEGRSTTYRFQYLTAAEYQANLDAGHDGFLGARSVPAAGANIGSSSSPQLAFFNLLGPFNPLVPATAYRYRAVASNELSPAEGMVRTLRTEAAGTPSGLPDGRGWEMVSPIEKGGGAIAGPGAIFGGAEIQAAVAGGALTFSSASAFAGSLGAPPASQYLSRRAAGGWQTESLTAPLASGVYGDHPDGSPYRLFSADLGQGLLFGGAPCRGQPGCASPAPPLPGSGAPLAYLTYYLRSASGYLSLLDATDFSHTVVAPEHFRVALAAASPDLSAVVLSSCAALSATAIEVLSGPGECNPAAQNLYRWSGGELEQLNLLPGQSSGAPGAAIAAPIGAVSADGARVYWTEGGDLFLRQGSQTLQVDAGQGGGGEFQTASADGRVAFFTKDGHLYRYDASTETAADLTPSGGVLGVLAASADATRLYYQDGTALWLWQQGAPVSQIAAGADAAAPSDYPPAAATVRLSADGTRLAFLSAAEIGDYDNRDAETHAPDTELYLYDPGQQPPLICASCQPTGERPQGSASIPGALVNGTAAAYRPRALSADGGRLFFDTGDALIKADTNSRLDVYQWERQGEGDCSLSPGCVRLISGGRGEGGSFLDASADAADAFFLTGDSLVGADPGSIDAYDARVGGGFAEPGSPFRCLGDACQPLPNAPEDPTPGTIIPSSGNPPLKIVREKPRHPRHRHHHHRKHHRGGRR
ncbi:MAG TPA: hypothetical protein VLL27_07580 [Solirubrobacterales bacterium]|nr:hypothetical protein [Solirubrobacterales bacterium]